MSDGKKESVFFPVTVFGKQAEIVAQYVTRGMQVLVEGRIEAREDGRMNVVADRVVFGDGGARSDRQPAQSGYEKAAATAKRIAE